MASSNDIKEENRDGLYKLYDFALKLEPKPEREELTFSQQQLVNRARSFVTMKMRSRLALRDMKQETKGMLKMKRKMMDSMEEQRDEVLKEIIGPDANKKEDKEKEEESKVLEKHGKENSGKIKDKG